MNLRIKETQTHKKALNVIQSGLGLEWHFLQDEWPEKKLFLPSATSAGFPVQSCVVASHMHLAKKSGRSLPATFCPQGRKMLKSI